MLRKQLLAALLCLPVAFQSAPMPVLAQEQPFVEETETSFSTFDESDEPVSESKSQQMQLKSVSPKSISQPDVVSKLATYTSYWPGKKWDERNGLGKQCYAFAHYIFNNLFGRGNITVGSYSGSTQYKFDAPRSDIITIGTVTPAGGQSDFAALLNQAAPGDYMQMKRRRSGGPHSAIVVSVDQGAGTISYIDANSDNANTCKLHNDSYSTFYNTNQGLSIYRYRDYNPSSSSSCNCSESYAGDYRCTSKSTLLIRSGHGTGYSSLGSIPSGATVHVSKADGTWAHVTYNGISGYSSMQYLEAINVNHDAKLVLDEVSVKPGVVRLRGWTFDEDVPNEASAVHMYVYNSAGDLVCFKSGGTEFERTDVNQAYNISGIHGFDFFWYIPGSGEMTLKLYSLNKPSGNNNLSAQTTVNMTADTTPPTVSDFQVVEATQDTITYRFHASDDSGLINNPRVAVWSKNNGQDDLIWKDLGDSIGEKDYEFSVKRSEHNGDYGEYYTHIYVYDHAGNEHKIVVNDLTDKVYFYKYVESLSFDVSSLTLKPGQTRTLQVIKTPSDSTLAETNWSSDNTSVASVSDGVITAKSAGSANITLTAKNGVSATCHVTVNEEKIDIETCQIEEIPDQKYTGFLVKPSITIRNSNGVQLVRDTDYTVSYNNNELPGTATVLVTGKGKYAGSIMQEFQILEPELTSISFDVSSVTLKVDEMKILEVQHSPTYSRLTKEVWLSSNTDVATVSSSGTIRAKAPGTAVITLTAQNGITATCRVTVEKISIANCQIENIPEQTWTGSAVEPDIIVRNNAGNLLYRNKDYTVSYSDNELEGTASATITGCGQYTGSQTVQFRIVKPLTRSISFDVSSITLKPGQTKTLQVVKNPAESRLTETRWSSSDTEVATVSGGTITAKAPGIATISLTAKNGIYAQCRVTVEEDKINLNACQIESVEEQKWTGSSIRPEVVIHNASGILLEEGTDYTLSYSNNKDEGTAQITVTGKGKYTGSKTVTFQIKKPVVSQDADAVVAIESVQTVAGETVRIPVSVTKNKGMAGLSIQFNYDKSVFENPRIEDTEWGGYWNSNTNNGIKAIWLGTENETSTGHVFDLLLDVKDTAAEGSYSITGAVDQDNTFNNNQQDVILAVQPGTVTVSQYLLGDVNLDGKVNNRDALMISQYVAEKITFNSTQLSAADFNGDGKVNNRDGFAIFQSVGSR